MEKGGGHRESGLEEIGNALSELSRQNGGNHKRPRSGVNHKKYERHESHEMIESEFCICLKLFHSEFYGFQWIRRVHRVVQVFICFHERGQQLQFIHRRRVRPGVHLHFNAGQGLFIFFLGFYASVHHVNYLCFDFAILTKQQVPSRHLSAWTTMQVSHHRPQALL